MKILAVITACVVVSYIQAELIITDEQREKLIEHHKECSKEIEISSGILEKLLDGDFPNDQSFKDYLFCISKKIGFQNEVGEVQRDVIIEKLRNSIEDPSKAEEYTDKCLVGKGNPSEVVYKVVSCLQESTPILIFS